MAASFPRFPRTTRLVDRHARRCRGAPYLQHSVPNGEHAWILQHTSFPRARISPRLDLAFPETARYVAVRGAHALGSLKVGRFSAHSRESSHRICFSGLPFPAAATPLVCPPEKDSGAAGPTSPRVRHLTLTSAEPWTALPARHGVSRTSLSRSSFPRRVRMALHVPSSHSSAGSPESPLPPFRSSLFYRRDRYGGALPPTV